VFLRDKVTYRAIQVDEGKIDLYRTIEPYPHTSLNFKLEPKLLKENTHQLVIVISFASEQQWSEQICNFRRWERNSLEEYEPLNTPFANPAYTYLKIQPIDISRDKVTFDSLENFVGLIWQPYEVALSKPQISVYVSNAEKLPIWFCAAIPKGIYAGVPVTISQFDGESNLIGSTIHFLDDHSKKCIETQTPETAEGHMLIEMLGDISYFKNAHEITIPVKIELNMNGAITKTIIDSKWEILTQVLALSMLKAILTTVFVANTQYLKLLHDNASRIIIVIIFLKAMERARFERIIIVLVVYSTVELVVTFWYFLMPRRPIYMATLQCVITMALKYAFIGSDGIVQYFSLFDSKALMNDAMGQDMKEALVDVAIACYALIGLIGWIACRGKAKAKVSEAEEKKQLKSEMLSNFFEYSLWVTITINTLYNYEYETY